MGHMKDFDRRIRQGGDDAVRAALEYALAVAARWIPVEERLPKIGQQVLVSIRPPHWPAETESILATQDYETAGFLDEHDGVPSKFVTHWMPLPEPPEVKS